MKIISISGPCGSGKSTVMSIFEKEFQILEVVYKNCKGSSLAPSLVESKLDYTHKWFSAAKSLKDNGGKIVFSDRSPIDCFAYIKKGLDKYRENVLTTMEDLQSSGIEFINILLRADKEILRRRIIRRSKKSPQAKKTYLKELKMLSSSIKFYKTNPQYFPIKIDNANLNPNETFSKIKYKLKKELEIDL